MNAMYVKMHADNLIYLEFADPNFDPNSFDVVYLLYPFFIFEKVVYKIGLNINR